MLVRTCLLVITGISRALCFAWAIVRFDAFVLSAGSSFFRFRELPLLRLLGKRVVYTLHGTDARPPYIDGFFEPEHYGLRCERGGANEESGQSETDKVKAYIQIAARLKRQLELIERYSNVVVCGPSYSHFLTRPFVSFYSVGIPVIVPRDQIERKESVRDKVRILHAPSYALGKGTDRIRSIMVNLERQGLSIEYKEISGRPNSEVLKEIENSDLIVDQVYSDTPMAMFAAEAASLGKPAVVGGYYSRVMRTHLPEDQIPPTSYCVPEKLQETVEKFVGDREKRLRLGDAARTFVHENWTTGKVASRFLCLLQGDPPQDWLIDPLHVMYVQGCGLSERRARENVAAVIRTGGVGALQLSHNPNLEKLFIKFAESNEADVKTSSS